MFVRWFEPPALSMSAVAAVLSHRASRALASSLLAARRASNATVGPSGACASSTAALASSLAPRRRDFFGVPSTSADDVREKTFSSTKLVPHSPAKLFDVVADVDKYEEFVPFCVASRVLRRGRGGGGGWGAKASSRDANETNASATRSSFEAELEIGFKLFNERYLSVVTLEKGATHAAVTAEAVTDAPDASGLFERLDTRWRFAPGSHDDECEVRFDIDFRVGSVIHAHAVGLFFEEVSKMQIEAFEERCDELYGRGGGARRREGTW